MGYGPAAGGLTIFRRVGEEIVVVGSDDEETVIIIEQASGGRCTLRIVAPPEVSIYRAETIGGSNGG
jgi:sRNA-binding carbon storage regulator CsrA